MLKNRIKIVIACATSLILLSSQGGHENDALPEPIVKHSLPAQYTLYLTFDDGPSDGSTIVNEVSRVDSLPINVFLIGKNTYGNRKSRSIYQDYLDNPWVEVGNHSYSHAKDGYHNYFKQPALVLADFNRNKDTLGLTSQLCRLPGRNFFRVGALERDESGNGVAAADTLAANGYKVFGWDLEWRNKAAKGFALHDGEQMFEIVSEILQKHKTMLPGGVIILLHDREMKDSTFRHSFEDFVGKARADGRFQFAHLSTYGS